MTNQRPKKRVLANAKSNRAKLEKILWDFLMDCLRIHHNQKDRKIKTIPEAQQKYAQAILDDGWVRKEDIELDEGKILNVLLHLWFHPSDAPHVNAMLTRPDCETLAKALTNAGERIVK